MPPPPKAAAANRRLLGAPPKHRRQRGCPIVQVMPQSRRRRQPTRRTDQARSDGPQSNGHADVSSGAWPSPIDAFGDARNGNGTIRAWSRHDEDGCGIGSLSDGARSFGYRMAARQFSARRADDRERQLDVDGSWRSQSGRRPSVRPARRRQGIRERDADGHGAAAARRRDLAVRAMVSPDPLMGPRGYPLLLASGETANGRDRLIDRQHPHDFFMELSVSASQNVGRKQQRLRLRRPAGRAGVRAAGLHASRGDHGFARGADHAPLAQFDPHQLRRRNRGTGRWPRQARGSAASTGANPISIAGTSKPGRSIPQRFAYPGIPTASLALQGSWGHFVDPEQLEPGVDQKRLSASALYAVLSRRAGSSRALSRGAARRRAVTATTRGSSKRR